VDGILVIFDTNHTDIQTILSHFKAIQSRLKFIAEIETNNTINYLDVTIHRTPTDWSMSIYRKPMFTYTIMLYTSNHPNQHKFAAVRFLHNRLNTYDLLTEDYKQEEQIIHNILKKQFVPNPPTETIQPKTKKTKGNHSNG
jgi:hypothetical protein